MKPPVIAAAIAGLILSASAALALDAPKGTVVLKVTGAITQTNAPGAAEFDMEMLSALQDHSTTAETPWTKGKSTFKGPLARAILAAVGAQGTIMKVTALNDYSSEVPIEDAEKYDVIFATTMDGKFMSVRDKGPLFVIYPFDTEPSLFTEVYFNRSVWQVASIEVK
jgi:hypothetical protein